MVGDSAGGVVNVYNLTKAPRALGIAVVYGFAAVLIANLKLLSIYSMSTLPAIVFYLSVVTLAINKAGDLRRLDWILKLSLGLITYISIIWVGSLLHE